MHSKCLIQSQVYGKRPITAVIFIKGRCGPISEAHFLGEFIVHDTKRGMRCGLWLTPSSIFNMGLESKCWIFLPSGYAAPSSLSGKQQVQNKWHSVAAETTMAPSSAGRAHLPEHQDIWFQLVVWYWERHSSCLGFRVFIWEMEFLITWPLSSILTHINASDSMIPCTEPQVLVKWLWDWSHHARLVARRGSPARTREWALVHPRKWIVHGDMPADKTRDFMGNGCLGREQQGQGT